MRYPRLGLPLLMLMLAIAASTLRGDELETNSAEGVNSERNIGDLICGPKCVRKILQLYGKEDEDIIRLVREIQWPDIRKGSPLTNVSDSLEKRGIHTYALEISSSARIVWAYPVIVHVKPPADETIGHYVIWLPESKGDKVKIWDGDWGIQTLSSPRFAESRSGVILLTSPVVIENSETSVVFSMQEWSNENLFLISMIIFVLGILCFVCAFPVNFLKGDFHEKFEN